MEEPVSTFRGSEFQGICLHGHDIHRILQRCIVTLSIQEPEEMTMQMHRMPHHRPVVQDDPYILTFIDQDPVRL